MLAEGGRVMQGGRLVSMLLGLLLGNYYSILPSANASKAEFLWPNVRTTFPLSPAWTPTACKNRQVNLRILEPCYRSWVEPFHARVQSAVA